MGRKLSKTKKSLTYCLFWIPFIFISLILSGFNYELSWGLVLFIQLSGVIIGYEILEKKDLKTTNIVIAVFALFMFLMVVILWFFQLISWTKIESKLGVMESYSYYQTFFYIIGPIVVFELMEKFKKIRFHPEFDTIKEVFSRTSLLVFIYVLVGLLFSQIYLTLQLNNKCSFEGALLSTTDAFYFSIVTQTTLGYGDVLPKSDVAKLFVTLHASLGVILLAIIAGLTISIALKQKDSEGKKTNI